MRFARTVPSGPEDRAVWAVRLTAPAALTPAIERVFEDRFVSLSVFEADAAGSIAVEACATEMPDRAMLEAALAIAAKAAGLAPPPLQVEKLPSTDWLAASYAAFPALTIGRFFIHGSHDPGPAPAGKIGLCIDAATAFGSGEHPTTEGCLIAIDRLAKRLRPARLLDMGCGTGILAFAMARRFGRPVVAADIDAESVRVARVNTRVNRLARRVRTILSAGYDNPAVAAGGPYDLIVANILARPLCRMAGDLTRHLAPGGTAVLSGLLDRQEAQVLSAHRAVGLHLAARIKVGVWPTLILRAGRH